MRHDLCTRSGNLVSASQEMAVPSMEAQFAQATLRGDRLLRRVKLIEAEILYLHDRIVVVNYRAECHECGTEWPCRTIEALTEALS